jgi:hypothetical protein
MAEKIASPKKAWVYGPDVPITDFLRHWDLRSGSDLQCLVKDPIFASER